MHNFRNLNIWKQGIEIVKLVYGIGDKFPNAEKFGLWSQMTRAAVSVPSNIAEGSGRTNKDFAHFLSIALGSLFELETQIIVAESIGYISQEESMEIQSHIWTLQKKISTFSQQLNIQ